MYSFLSLAHIVSIVFSLIVNSLNKNMFPFTIILQMFIFFVFIYSKRNTLSVADFVTSFRIYAGFIWLVVIFYYQNLAFGNLSVIIFMAITSLDFVDGFVARRYPLTAHGEFFDAEADSSLNASMAMFCFFFSDLGFLILAIVLWRVLYVITFLLFNFSPDHRNEAWVYTRFRKVIAALVMLTLSLMFCKDEVINFKENILIFTMCMISVSFLKDFYIGLRQFFQSLNLDRV